MKKIICCLVIIAFLLSIAPATHSLSTKTKGKLALVAILSGVAALTKYLVKRNRRTAEDLHAQLGKPDHAVEFERGFDCWRVERYGNRRYFFKNDVLYKVTKKK